MNKQAVADAGLAELDLDMAGSLFLFLMPNYAAMMNHHSNDAVVTNASCLRISSC